MLTVPLIVSGADRLGKRFKVDARTVTLNRHGALIDISRPLFTGQRIRIMNPIAQIEADFSVVGPVIPRTEKGGQWGVESLDSQANIWGIQFPPPLSKPEEPSALLECRKCHRTEVQPVSLVEVEVLNTAGILNRPCANCGANTPWGYKESAFVRATNQRRHPRVSVQLPVFVRDYYGGVEISKSQNVSKGGFCFVSEKNYHVGAGIMVVCPYRSSETPIEIPARVLRRSETAGTQAKVYGIRYEQVH